MNKSRLTAIIAVISLFLISISFTSCGKGELQPFTFAHLTDSQFGIRGDYDGNLATFKQAITQVNELEPDFVVITGDLVHTNNDSSYDDFKSAISKLTMPVYSIPGNHDVEDQPTINSLERYRRIIGKDYYSIEHKGRDFVFVNTQLWKSPLAGETEKHDEWFTAVLKASHSNDREIFVVGHIPLFLAEPGEGDDYFNIPPAKRPEILSLIEENGVVAFISGHTHKTIINDYKGIQMVSSESTSLNIDEHPFGFRIWHIGGTRPFVHEFIPVELKK